jgi:hypothetical protein
MEIFEHLGRMTYINALGDQHILYPVTKKECVEGLYSIEKSIGNIDQLETEDKSSIVAALNEVRTAGNGNNISDIQDAINEALEKAKQSGEFDGRGIVSIVRTSGNGAAGSVDTYTITYTDNTKTTFNIYNGANGADGSDGSDGSGSSVAGENGATFIPSVDSNGNLSWTNDKGLANPETVNIKGFPGKDGVDGIDGVSPSVTTANVTGGNQITITDKSGTKSFVVRDGADGANGKDGVGILNINQTTTSTESGGTNVITVTLENGETSTFNIKNGTNGENGVSVSSVMQTNTSSANGGTNTITVTLSDGTKSTFNVKNGTAGINGENGVSVSNVVQSTTSSEDGGTNVITVTLSDGTQKTFSVKNGRKGTQGTPGVNATINGENALTLNTGVGITTTQNGNTMTISANYEYGQNDLTPGESALATGKLYFVYE